MVRDYVTGLYVPGAQASRLLTAEQDGSSFAAARELAAWKHKVSMAWDGVRIEHVEADDGLRHGPGDALLVRASVALGKLSPADVAVEVVGGRVDSGDEIVEPVASGMSLDEASGDAGIARYEGRADLRLGRGPSGTPCGSCPVIRCWPPARRWAWWPSRGAYRDDQRRPALTG